MGTWRISAAGASATAMRARSKVGSQGTSPVIARIASPGVEVPFGQQVHSKQSEEQSRVSTAQPSEHPPGIPRTAAVNANRRSKAADVRGSLLTKDLYHPAIRIHTTPAGRWMMLTVSGIGVLGDDRRTILRLVLFGFFYNVIEGILSITLGIRAGSVVLVGFGLDSGIEAAAAFAAWRFLQGELTEEGEEKLSRIVGWTFLALSAYVVLQSAFDLLGGEEVSPSKFGLVVTAASLVVMPFIGVWKLRLSRRMGSRGLEAEAKETIACAYLSFFAVFGVGVRYLGGPSWVDPVAALLMVPWLIREGLERVKGEAET